MESSGNAEMTIPKGEWVTIFFQGKKYTTRISHDRVSVGGMTFPGDLLIGKSFGINDVAGVRMIVLPASPRDHMDTMKRGPQIILPWDASTILFYADIRSGKTIIEAGSGSGSLTIAMASAVAPSGHVFSLDLKSRNLDIARKNVQRSGFSDVVSFIRDDIRDLDPATMQVLSQSSEKRESVHDQVGDDENVMENCQEKLADAVVLDMPDPWNALSTIEPLLKIGGCLVSYLPTMNQLEELRSYIEGWNGVESGDGKYIDIFTLETIHREISVKKGSVRPDYSMLGHTGYLTFGRKI